MNAVENRTRILGFPRRYIQGAGALRDLASLVAVMPRPMGVVIESNVLALLPDDTAEQLRALAADGAMLEFAGECTRAQISVLSARAKKAGVRSVIALGGGKTLDTGKGIAKALGRDIVIAPTIASNDAPTSRLIVLYHEDHRVDGVEYLDWNPTMVVVDTQVIANAPVRFTRAGVGDALSKRFELDQVFRANGKNFFGGSPSAIARAFADMAFSTLMEDAEAALAACEDSTVNASLENVVEASVLASGAGFENGGLSLAHAMCRGLGACEATNSALHGEMVAFALLVQLRLTREGVNSLDELLALYERIHLPLGFADLGAQGELTREQLIVIAEGLLGAPYAGNFERAITIDEIIDALQTQDEHARKHRARKQGTI